MNYLQKRVLFLFEQIESGNFRILKEFAKSDNGKQLMNDLSKVKRLENGEIDLETCSPLVRLTAKTAFFVKQNQEEVSNGFQKLSSNNSIHTIKQITKAYFALLDNFFIEATGKSADRFDFEEYRQKVISGPNYKLSEKARKAFETYIPKILEFHQDNSSLLLNSSNEIGGLKCVLGGTSRFTNSSLLGVRKFALYADTIFIPDPILPFIEVERPEEKFPIIELMLACRTLLLLKPLVDADLSYPAIVVFPSWEKRLEAIDNDTQDGISQLTLDFFSYYLKARFEDESELVKYITGSGKDVFVEAVNNQHLFWPPEEDTPLSFHSGFEVYKKWLKIWRTKQWTEDALNLSPELLILNGIFERLVPQYHIRENAQNFSAQPLFSLSPNFHYFLLTSNATNSQLSNKGFLNQTDQSVLQSLLSPKIAWLGNVPMKDLAKLREDGCNEEFRKQLFIYTNELHNSTYRDLDKVANDVIRGVQSLLDKHDREARQIESDYFEKHLTTLGTSVLTLASSFIPSLDPLFGLAALAPAGKLASDLWSQIKDETKLSKSLIGVLSQAKER
ncbi:MAG: hypothetical protein J0M11_11865 [Anaerolineae bacterium]|nr:hypothetical protein [Anaerolineae bacterium]